MKHVFKNMGDADGEYYTAADYDALAAELADWKRMRNEAMAVAISNRTRINELEAALRGIAEDYVCIGVRNVHTGACVGCPVCDARDALTPSETGTEP